LLENHGGKQHGEKGLKKGDMEMEKKACIAKKKKNFNSPLQHITIIIIAACHEKSSLFNFQWPDERAMPMQRRRHSQVEHAVITAAVK
jgi:hypothetical protein